MALNYYKESSHIADYDLYTLPGVDFTLRGPAPALEAPSPMIACLGAAQVFGTFCSHPFPALLGEMCAARVLNLGAGGAGPGFYTDHPRLIALANTANVAVVQVMSARSSISNRYMQSVNGRASVRLTLPGEAPKTLLGHHAFDRLLTLLTPDEFRAVIDETLENFVAQYAALVEALTVPAILLYVGRNPPIEETTRNRVGTHPHLVTETIMSRLAPLFDDTVRVIGDPGAEARLLNRFTGQYETIPRSETYAVTTHSAYISPHMHARTALALYDPVKARL